MKDRKKQIGERIRVMRQSRDMTQTDLAEATGYGQTSITMWESGQRMPNAKAIDALADAFNVPPYAIMYSEDEMRSMLSGVTPIDNMQKHRVPLISSVAGGQPILAENDWSVWVDGPIKAQYALRLEGHSMEPTYMDRDVIYIREQPDVDNGQIAVVLLDDSGTLKRVYHKPNGLLLLSDNPEYPPIDAKSDEYTSIRILGVPVGYTRMYK